METIDPSSLFGHPLICKQWAYGLSVLSSCILYRIFFSMLGFAPDYKQSMQFKVQYVDTTSTMDTSLKFLMYAEIPNSLF
jgi:hypothetical protein